ncbi:MAG: helix-turn-helix domain-containing protein [Methanoregula sp.]
MTITEDRDYTVEEAAAAVKVVPGVIRKLIERGDIVATKSGAGYLIHERDFKIYLGEPL